MNAREAGHHPPDYPIIGIGASSKLADPSHTTRHAGPHRAVGIVEVRALVEIPAHRLRLLVSDPPDSISRCQDHSGFTLISHTGELRDCEHLRHSKSENQRATPPIPSALRSMLAATMASADFSLRVSTSPFQAQGEISPGKNAILHRTTAGFTPPEP